MAQETQDAGQLLLELGYFCVKAGRTAEAQVLLKGAGRLRPRDPAPGMFLGMSLFAAADYESAERAYRQVLERHDDDLTRSFLAESLLAQKRWAEARALLEEVKNRGRHPAAALFAGELLQALEHGLFARA